MSINPQQAILSLILQSGFSEAGLVEQAHIRYYPDIRKICEANSCRGYAASWACPPAVGTLDECKARIERFDDMVLFSKKYDLEDSFDFEGMQHGLHNFKKLLDVLNKRMKSCSTEFLLLGNEGCDRCTKCTYPHSPCRFPDLLYHSIEGYGFIVSDLAQKAGIRYNNGANTVTFFGALLYKYPDTDTQPEDKL